MRNLVITIILIILLLVSIFLVSTVRTSNNKTKLKTEVFQLGKNVYRYMEAQAACEDIGARLATERDLQNAHKSGAHWCNLGWVRDIKAFFPLQKSSKCGKKGLNGEKMQSQLKLGATCVGYKPKRTKKNVDKYEILPFSKKKWSQYD